MSTSSASGGRVRRYMIWCIWTIAWGLGWLTVSSPTSRASRLRRGYWSRWMLRCVRASCLMWDTCLCEGFLPIWGLLAYLRASCLCEGFLPFSVSFLSELRICVWAFCLYVPVPRMILFFDRRFIFLSVAWSYYYLPCVWTFNFYLVWIGTRAPSTHLSGFKYVKLSALSVSTIHGVKSHWPR